MMTEGIAGCSVEEIQNEFSSPWTNSDIVFVVQGRRLHCNKAVLSMVSPVFVAMFQRDFKEKTMCEVPLPGKNYDDMVEFFQCIHPHVRKEVTDEKLEVLLILADEYQCKILTKQSRDFLARQLERCQLKSQIKQLSVYYAYDISGQAILRWLRLVDQFVQDTKLFKELVVELEKRMTFVDLEK